MAEKNAILVICNRLSKIAHFMTMVERTSVEGLVRLFKDNAWKLHRLLESIIRGSFTLSEFKFVILAKV